MDLIISIIRYFPYDLRKVNFFALAVFVILIFLLTRIRWSDEKDRYGWGYIESEKQESFWKVGLIHAMLGGYAYPLLFSFFGAIGFIKTIWLLFSLSGETSSAGFLWFSEFFQSKDAFGTYLLQSLLYYCGLWVGIPASYKVLRRLYHPERGREVFVWSIVWFSLVMALSLVYEYFRGADPYSTTALSLFDVLIRLAFFIVISKWYLYRILVTDIKEK